MATGANRIDVFAIVVLVIMLLLIAYTVLCVFYFSSLATAGNTLTTGESKALLYISFITLILIFIFAIYLLIRIISHYEKVVKAERKTGTEPGVGGVEMAPLSRKAREKIERELPTTVGTIPLTREQERRVKDELTTLQSIYEQ